MNDIQLETLEQIGAFLSGAQALEFIIEYKTERYAWIQCTPIRLELFQRVAHIIITF